MTTPLMISSAKLRVMGDSTGEMLSEIFDGRDREYTIEFKRDEGSGYEMEWKGFLATDLWQDNPNKNSEVIELEAIDGISLLENIDFDPPLNDMSLNDILRGILTSLYFDEVSLNMEWYPYLDGTQWSNDVLPLNQFVLDQDAFNELESVGEKDFEVVEKASRRAALEGILERFQMRCFQSKGKWIARQRGQIRTDRSIFMWQGEDNDNKQIKLINRELTNLVDKNERPRSLVRRLRQVKSTYNYKKLGNLVKDPSFENNSGEWTEVEFDGGVVQRGLYSQDNPDNPNNLSEPDNTERPPTNNDEYFYELWGQEQADDVAGVEQTTQGNIRNIGPKGVLRISWDHMRFYFNDFHFSAELDGYFLQGQSVESAGTFLPGENVSIRLKNPLNGSNNALRIPKGYSTRVDGNDDNGNYQSFIINIKENVYAGDNIIIADIPEKVTKGTPIQFAEWGPGSWDFNNTEHINDYDTPGGIPQKQVGNQYWVSPTVEVPLVTPDGTILEGKPTIRPWIEGNNFGFVDHFSVKPFLNGEPLEETSYTALDDQSGRSIERTHLIGDGPYPEHPRNLHLPSSSPKIYGNWKREAYDGASPTPTDKTLDQMYAEEVMRQQRDTVQRRVYNFELREDEDITPEDAFEIDGDVYTVSYLKRTYGGSGDRAEVEVTELPYSGISGLTRAFYTMDNDAEGGTGGGGGSGGSGGSGGTGPTMTVERLQDEVNNLLSSGGDITLTYDDANNDLKIETSAGGGLSAEEVQDEVNSLLSSGGDITLTYDDQNDDLKIEYTGSSGGPNHTITTSSPSSGSGSDGDIWFVV